MMKRYRLLSTILVFVYVSILSVPAFAAGTYDGGDGSEANPYRIAEPNDLQEIGANSDDWDKYFLQTADIDLSAYTGTQFNLIGYYEEPGDPDNKPFFGTYDGNGYTISNFTYSCTGQNKIGMFRSGGGQIKNVRLVNPQVDAGNGDYVGALIGDSGGYPGYPMSGCSVEGGSVSGDDDIGGLVGYLGAGSITNCSSSCLVTGDHRVGGILGCLEFMSSISNCRSAGTVIGSASVGGIVGSSDGYLSDNFAAGRVEGAYHVGGVVGSQTESVILRCGATAEVEGGSNVGGLAGATYYPLMFEECYAKGNVSGQQYVGGLIGYAMMHTLNNCYSSGDVTGQSDVGGLIGSKVEELGILNCYSSGQIIGTTNVGGLLGSHSYIAAFDSIGSIWNNTLNPDITGVGNQDPDPPGLYGKSTYQMLQKETYVDLGWDFETIWDICDGTNYPRLAWQEPIPGDFVCPEGIDLRDFAFFANYWLQQNCESSQNCHRTDLNQSGAVDLPDLMILLDRWLDFPTIIIPPDSIQEAINAADYGETVYIPAGTYVENITLKNGVALVGAGPDVTIIDGDAVASVVACIGCDSNTHLEGFTITNGLSAHGGGMYNLNASPTITDCIFSYNRTPNGLDGDSIAGGDGGSGGAMYNDHASPMINRCIFMYNSTGKGGTGWCFYPGGNGGSGAGIYNTYSSPVIYHCTFSYNSTGHGGYGDRGCISDGGPAGNGGAGAGIYNDYSNPEMIHCRFESNTTGAGGKGGQADYDDRWGIGYSGGIGGVGGDGAGMYNLDSSPTLKLCTFSHNRTGNGGQGGDSVESWMGTYGGDGGDAGCGAGMCNYNSSPMVFGCLVHDNLAGDGGAGMEDEHGGGGAVDGGDGGNGGGMNSVVNSLPILTNCSFHGNTAGTGGWGWDMGEHVINGEDGQGGGIYNDNASPTVTNCILWNDTPDEVFNTAGADPNVSYCDVQGGYGLPEDNNIEVDPLYADAPGEDFHLLPQSLCIDAGTNHAVPPEITTDLDGYPRIMDGNKDGLAVVDMGVYEYSARNISRGTAIVDGDLSDWSSQQEWINLDQIYSGDPNDITEAQVALRWDPNTNKVYAAVVVTDTDHVFTDEYITWDASDRIEIYTQGSAAGGTGWYGNYGIAQHYMVGPDTSGGSWGTWALGQTIDPNADFEYAVQVVGNQIIYEIGITQFDYYSGIAGGDLILTSLYPCRTIRLDILASSRHASGFGMRSENLMTGKYLDADQFAQYLLVE